MKLKMYIVACAIFSLSACATSNSDVADENASSSSDKTVASDSELVCKREKIIGSNFSRKVCFTRESKEDAADDSRQRLERMRNQRGGTTGNVQ